MKEVQHTIVNSLVACSQFINLVPKVICLRAAQIVAYLLKPLKTREALPLRLGRNAVKPTDQRNRALILAIVKDINARH
jgi:hypothetical protein